MCQKKKKKKKKKKEKRVTGDAWRRGRHVKAANAKPIKANRMSLKRAQRIS